MHALIVCSLANAQKLCPTRAAVFPVGSLHDDRDPARRMRFEIRECAGGFIQVLQFEQDARKPARVIETGEGWPPSLAHVRNTLVLENAGGVATVVFLLNFKDGKAMRPIRAPTTGHFRLGRSSEGVFLHVIVPPVETMNGVFAKERTYRFMIE